MRSREKSTDAINKMAKPDALPQQHVAVLVELLWVLHDIRDLLQTSEPVLTSGTVGPLTKTVFLEKTAPPLQEMAPKESLK